VIKVKKDDSRTGNQIKVGEPMNKESDRLSAQQEQPLEVPSESQL